MESMDAKTETECSASVSTTEPCQPTLATVTESVSEIQNEKLEAEESSAGDTSRVLEHNAANATVKNGTDLLATEQTANNDSDKKSGEMEVVTDTVVSEPTATGSSCLTPRDAGFTSEKFKIEVTELPRKFGFAQLKKRLSVTLGLKPHKLKALPMKSFAFICFGSEEDRDQALEAINGHVWKGRTLQAKKAQPAADPMKRKHEESVESAENAKKAKVDSNLPPAIRLRSRVEPLWEVPYEEQLKRKTDKAKEALKAVAFHGDVKVQFMKARKENDGMCCPLEPIIPSPVKEGYRNKSEFSVGRSEDGSERVVGFRFGLYKDGTDGVGSPSEISIIPHDSKKVVQSFEKYVRQSEYTTFDHRTHSGHWRQLTVRTAKAGGGILAVAEFVVHHTTKDQMDTEKQSIKQYFTEGEGEAANVTTFFFRPCSAQFIKENGVTPLVIKPLTSNSTSEEPYELIYGDGHIYETMMDMKFRISPSAFFQVNTAAAEVLYKQIADWCKATPTTTILDICCGTGTIGQTMAKTVAKVIGIEMCKEAIEDAKVNATLNAFTEENSHARVALPVRITYQSFLNFIDTGVTNVDYHCAKVENVISDIIRSVNNDDFVAILDPPRGGVHQSVIKSLRSCHGLNRIVYAACNPAGAKQNFIDFCRPESRKTRGEPFKFVRAIPIDMFPSTMHFELLVLLERQPSQKKTNSDSE